ncbi:hypothetical protein M0R45_008778 [Rubus argutus]|uniref:F-box domain-containing protein n=1 Tax=Rubus argutus TaxID=59490 RepID=A0AAW1Y2A1_RUBAR
MSDYFPEEIIHKILLRLPVKPLIKFSLVCKSWMSLIKSSTFIQSHLRTTIDSNDKNGTHLLLLSASSYSITDRILHHHHWLRWDSPEFGEYSKLISPVVVNKKRVAFHDLRVVGTCNGLVCLESDNLYGHRSPTLLWNPSVRKTVIFPSPPMCFPGAVRHPKCITHGFGYDSHSGDYKILRIATLFSSHLEVQVYSLARGSWKSLVINSVVAGDLKSGRETLAFVNGSLHILKSCTCLGDRLPDALPNLRGDNFITSFNLATELFGQVMMPEALGKDGCSLSRYGDSLALIKCRPAWDDPRGTDIWVMKEYGVAESWTFLFNIALVQVDIYGLKRCGEVVLRETNTDGESRTISLDPKSNEVKYFGTGGCDYYFMDSFVESLVFLDHANAISV